MNRRLVVPVASFGVLLAGLIAAVTVFPRVAESERAPVPMPREWTQFRLNGFNDPVIAFNGTPHWAVETHGAFSSSPAIVDNTVYIGNNKGGLYALDLSTGDVRWVYHVQNPIMSNPLVYNGIVIIGEGNANSTTYVPRHKVQVGDGPNALIGIDAKTGKQVWKVDLSGTGMPTPAIVDGILVHHNGSGGLMGVDPRTGNVLYRKYVKSVASMVGVLPIPNDLVVTTGIFPNRVFAFHPQTGEIAWQYQLSDNDSGVGDCPPVSDGSHVFGDYLAPPDPKNQTGDGVPGVEHVYALDAKTGQLLWNVGLEQGMVGPRNESAIPLVVGHTLYLGSAIAPYMHAIDTDSGKVLWSTKVEGTVLGGVVEQDGRIFFGDNSGNLWALDAKNGNVDGKLTTPSGFNVGSPVIVGKSLIIGSKAGTIYAMPIDRILASR